MHKEPHLVYIFVQKNLDSTVFFQTHSLLREILLFRDGVWFFKRDQIENFENKGSLAPRHMCYQSHQILCALPTKS